MPTIQKGYRRWGGIFSLDHTKNPDDAWEAETSPGGTYSGRRQLAFQDWAAGQPQERVDYYSEMLESVTRLNQLPEEQRTADTEFKSLFENYWSLKATALGGTDNMRRPSGYWRQPDNRQLQQNLTVEQQGEWDILTNLFEGVNGSNLVYEYDPTEGGADKLLPQREQLSGAIQIGATEARRVKTGRGKQQFTSPGGGVQL
jgi:hypothetical protein